MMAEFTTSEFTDAELATMDLKVRNLVTMCLYNNNSYEAAAEQYGIPVGTVKSRIHRVRAKISALRAKALVQAATAAADASRDHPVREGVAP